MSAAIALTFETNILAAALREVRGAVQRRNTIPILSNVLIEADASGTVRLTATDLDVMVTRVLSAKVEAATSFTVDANRLADVVGTFTAGSQTTIRHEHPAATVTSGRARLRFATLPRADFPILEQKDVAAQFTMDPKALTRAMGAVRHAVSTEETRYYLNGVFIHAEGDKLTFVAVDGHRLARYVDDLPPGAAAMPDTIIRTRCIDLVRGAAEARDAQVELFVGDGKVTMATGDYTIVAKVVDGQYPDYARTIPAHNDRIATIDRDALYEAVNRVAVAVSEKVRAVKIEVGNDLLRTSVVSPEHGEAADHVSCTYGSRPIEIGFNSRYLRDALGVFDVDQIDIAFGDRAGPALITSPKASNLTLVIMPLRV